MNPNPELDPKLENMLQAMRRSTPRDPEIASRAREAFLAETAQIASQPPRVFNSTLSHLNSWKEFLNTIRLGTQKQPRPMINLVLTALLILGTILGSGVTTVAAAQVAQPDESLYPIKTWSEDVRIDWEGDPQAKFDLLLQFTARRAEEIQSLFAADRTIPKSVLTRFENQEQQALDLAASMSDDQTLFALERVRDQAREQKQTMAQLHVQDYAAKKMHTRIQTMLQTQEQMAQHGIQNLDWLRQQLRHRNLNGDWLSTPISVGTEPTLTPLSDSNPSTTVTPTSDKSFRFGGSQNPRTTSTHMPGSGYSPIPGTGERTPNPPRENPMEKPDSGSENGKGNGGGNNDGGNGQNRNKP